MVQPFFDRPESSTAILIAATELAPPMSAYRLDMSLSTPILTVLFWASAGAARPNPAHASSAAACRVSVVFIEFPPAVDARMALFSEPCQGLDRAKTILVPDSPSAVAPQCAYRSASEVSLNFWIRFPVST